MAGYSLNPEDYLTLEQLEYLKDHAVMNDVQLAKLQEQIMFLRDYNLSTEGGKNIGNYSPSEKRRWDGDRGVGKQSTVEVPNTTGTLAPAGHAPKRVIHTKKSSGARKEPKTHKRKVKEDQDSEEEIVVSELESTSQDESPADRAGNISLQNPSRPPRQRRPLTQYADVDGEDDEDDDDDEEEEEDGDGPQILIPHSQKRERTPSGSLQTLRVAKRGTNKQTQLKELQKVTYEWDKEPCGVCGISTWEDGNQMILCDGPNCDFTAHIGCYGLLRVPDDDPWLCDGCKVGLNPLDSNCVLCPVTGGVLREVSNLRNCQLPRNRGKKVYAHICCALWCGGAAFDDQSKLMGINLSGLKNANTELLCTVCFQIGNGCTQCCFPRCIKPFHVLCGRHMDLKTAMKYEGGTLSFCVKHSFEDVYSQQVEEMLKGAVHPADPDDMEILRLQSRNSIEDKLGK